jgi:hypothetical protein
MLSKGGYFACLASSVHQSCLDLIRQRVYQIAAGYEDANDATTPRCGPGKLAKALKVAWNGDHWLTRRCS